jgi:hypothetical protein
MSWPYRQGKMFIAAAALLGTAAIAAGGEPTARERALGTIAQAERESAEIESRYWQARRDCEKGFFVSPCQENARRERDQRLRSVREREVAARDALRQIDAEERAKAREQRSGAEATAPKDRAGLPDADRQTAAPAKPTRTPAPPRAVDQKEREAAATAKRVEAEQRRAEADRRAAVQAAEGERRAAQQAEKAAQASARVVENEQRQREAQERAAEKARIAEEHRLRRERRAAERAAKADPGSNGPR